MSVGETNEKAAVIIARRLMLGVLATAICAVSVYRADLPKAFTSAGLWDFETYYYAVKVFDAGGNPWNQAELRQVAGDSVLPFIYPHHTLAFFRLFASGDIAFGKTVYLSLKLACAACLCLLWALFIVRPGALGWFLAFLTVGFNAALCRDVVSGNVALFEQLLIWIGIVALLSGRPGLFCLFILLAAQFKLMPLCLLALVLLTDSRRKWHWFGGGLAAAGLIGILLYWSNPSAMAEFWKVSTDLGMVEPGGERQPSSLALIREAALAVVEQCSGPEVQLARTIGGWAYLAFAVGMLAFFVRRVRKAGRDRFDLRHSVYLALLTFALLAPRMKDYTYVLLLPVAFEALRAGLAMPKYGRWLVIVVVVVISSPGTDILWPYRPLLLAGLAWWAAMSGSLRTVQ